MGKITKPGHYVLDLKTFLWWQAPRAEQTRPPLFETYAGYA
jgi:hypothetical protein